MGKYYAHSLPGKPDTEWQSLEEHLRNVADKAALLAQSFNVQDWAEVAGLLHDIGKYSTAFQKRIKDGKGKKRDHASAGFHYLMKAIRENKHYNDNELWQLAELIGKLIGHCLAGHHTGLLDGSSIGETTSLDERLEKQVDEFERNMNDVLITETKKMVDKIVSEKYLDIICQWITSDGTVSGREAFSLQFLVRMIFSTLIDADRLDAERVTNPNNYRSRTESKKDNIDLLLKKLEEHLQTMPKNGDINSIRNTVSQQCVEAAKMKQGFFSLTVPTGGGKTLASLRFALHHAQNNSKPKRIFYVLPYTTIVEQNADVFRKILDVNGTQNILEDHSNIEPEKENEESRLLSENWDVPIVVTTSVQFFNSLYKAKPSNCRRLHNIAESIIILDEAQTVPVRYLQAITWALEELVSHYGCSVVFSTATQPILDAKNLNTGSNDDHRIGLKTIHEIVPDTESLFRSLKRVHIYKLTDTNSFSIQEVAKHLQDKGNENKSILSIVNTKKNAAALYYILKEVFPGRVFHLSTAMCAKHRLDALRAIRVLLRHHKEGDMIAPIVVSTQLIEAGVDIDFEVVYRAISGIDSIAQAAGRCNREGLHKEGEVFIYQADEKLGSLRDIIEARQHGIGTLSALENSVGLSDEQRDPIGLISVKEYFQRLYWARRSEMDSEKIVSRLISSRSVQEAANIPFASVGDAFNLIEKRTVSLVVPYGVEGMALVERLKATNKTPYEISLNDIRMAQRYSVQVWEEKLDAYKNIIIELPTGICVLNSTKHYDLKIGLLGPNAISVEDFIV